MVECKLWQQAKDKYVALPQTCPMSEYCMPGTQCVYLAHKLQQIDNQPPQTNRFSYLRGSPQEVPQERTPEVLKHHIKRDGRR
jgi:hypothetical protein